MTLKPLILLASLLFTAAMGGAIAQNQEAELSRSAYKRLQKAKTAFDEMDYSTAIQLYRDVNRKEEIPDSSKIRLARAYIETNDQNMAEAVFKEVGLENLSGDDLYYFSQTLRYNGKYIEAGQAIKKFIEENPHDQRAKLWENKDNLAQKLLQEKNYTVSEVNFNSRYSDFSPLIQNGIMYFTSSRPAGTVLKNNEGGSFLNIFRAEHYGNSFMSPEIYVTDFKTRYNDGPVSFNIHGTEIFITRNIFHSLIKTKGDNGFNRLSIVYSRRKPDGTWTTPEELPFNDPSYSCAHAFLTEDGNRLWFVSDMPGGNGGTDIYYVEKQNQKWGQPVNAGDEINTPGDEMFPFVDNNGLLYFSSDGHPGLGGLDLFVAKEIEGEYVVKNMGYPINSSKDDFSIFIEPGGRKGYFASNRPGSTGSDDIYKFEVLHPVIFEKPQRKFQGIVIDKNTKEPVSGAILGILDNQGNYIQDITTDHDGSFFLSDTISKEITIIAAEEYFYPFEESFSLSNHEDTVMVALSPKPVYGVKGILTRAPGNVPVPSVSLFIHAPGSETDTMRTENDGSFRLKLNPYSNYYIVFYKPGYFPSGLPYSTSGRDTGYVDLNQLAGLELEPALTGKSYPLSISYEQNSLDTVNGSQLLLDAVSQLLKDNESWIIEIGVHTSSRGDAETNLHNSRQRAQSVAAYLESAGIDPSRISAKGFGEQQLINDCADGIPCTEEEHEENERTKITILNR